GLLVEIGLKREPEQRQSRALLRLSGIAVALGDAPGERVVHETAARIGDAETIEEGIVGKRRCAGREDVVAEVILHVTEAQLGEQRRREIRLCAEARDDGIAARERAAKPEHRNALPRV